MRRGTKPGPTVPQQRMARILSALKRSIPVDRVELNSRSPFELLVATILSAQCTDARVNQVTPTLFHRFPDAAAFARADVAEVARMIRPTGFHQAKARNLVACGRALIERYGGLVPKTMEQLVSLPGVGRKTANVILGQAFSRQAVVVDTHVQRVSTRLGFVDSAVPEEIELELQRLIPRLHWTRSSQRLLLHGRYVCTARTPKCAGCVLDGECSWEGKRLRR